MEGIVASQVCTALPDAASLQSSAIASLQSSVLASLQSPTIEPGSGDLKVKPSKVVDLRPELLSYHLLRPREAGLADVALIGEAYRCWREVWSETLLQLDGETDVPSDEFTRQDEVGAIFYGYECVALSCFRYIDLASPMHNADSYFRIWPESARAAAAREGTRVCIGSQITVAANWRRVRGCSLRHLVTALTLERFIASDKAAILGTMRDDRGMDKLSEGLGTRPLGHARLHGVPVTLCAFFRSSTRPVLSERQEGIVRRLAAGIPTGDQR